MISPCKDLCHACGLLHNTIGTDGCKCTEEYKNHVKHVYVWNYFLQHYMIIDEENLENPISILHHYAASHPCSLKSISLWFNYMDRKHNYFETDAFDFSRETALGVIKQIEGDYINDIALKGLSGMLVRFIKGIEFNSNIVNYTIHTIVNDIMSLKYHSKQDGVDYYFFGPTQHDELVLFVNRIRNSFIDNKPLDDAHD